MKNRMKTKWIALCSAILVPVWSWTATVISDGFNAGAGVTSQGVGSLQVIANGWYGSGPEAKAYNTTNGASSEPVDFTGKLGFMDTGAGSWDGVYKAFSSQKLADIGDSITLTFDYKTLETVNSSGGLRVRLYKQGANLAATTGGYGLLINTGTDTSKMYYYSDTTTLFTGSNEGTARLAGTANGDGNVTVVFTVTKTGASEITLSGSYDGTALLSLTATVNPNYTTFDAVGFSVGSTAHGLEIDNLSIANSLPEPYVCFEDDFESGSISYSTNGAYPLINDWEGEGPELKEYNVASSGVLNIRDHLDNEKGDGTTHSGYWDIVRASFTGVAITNEGDWVQLSLDVGAYVDDSGAPMDNDYGMRVSLVDSSATVDAGYGFQLGTGDKGWNYLKVFNDSTGYGVNLGSASFNQPEDGGTYPLILKVSRLADSLEIESSFGGSSFGLITNSAALDKVFNLLTITVTDKDYGCRIDNVKITSNVQSTAYDQWLSLYGLSGTNALYSVDPDGDGFSNMYEWGLGGDPTNAFDQGILPTYDTSFADGTNWFIYTFPSNPSADLVYYIQTCDDLVTGSWTSDGPVAGTGIHSENAAFYAVTNKLLMEGKSQRFIKLIIEQ